MRRCMRVNNAMKIKWFTIIVIICFFAGCVESGNSLEVSMRSDTERIPIFSESFDIENDLDIPELNTSTNPYEDYVYARRDAWHYYLYEMFRDAEWMEFTRRMNYENTFSVNDGETYFSFRLSYPHLNDVIDSEFEAAFNSYYYNKIRLAHDLEITCIDNSKEVLYENYCGYHKYRYHVSRRRRQVAVYSKRKNESNPAGKQESLFASRQSDVFHCDFPPPPENICF
jgi:hypothetical protein